MLEAPHVVIVGAGFGGLQATRELAESPVRITLVDQHNYHLFQPLLYQVATAGLAPEEIAYPVRTIFRGQKNVTFRMAQVQAVDFAARRLQTSTGELCYDYLILAVGGMTNFFGIESMAANGFGLKNINDAVGIRNHILRMVERASQERDEQKRRAMLTFVVVGGGPTGVESAGALSELIRLVLVKDYPRLSLEEVGVVLLEASAKLLAGMPDELRDFASCELGERHVEVRFGAVVADFDGQRVLLKNGDSINSQTVIWAAGVRAAPITDELGLKQGTMGRIVVTPTLQLAEHKEVFVIGDAAYLEKEGRALPMVAPVAVQQAKTAAENIRRLQSGNQQVQEFVYKDPGVLATIGRSAAVAHFNNWAFKGWFAWFLWLVIHIIRLAGFRNRFLVLINWAWDYFFYENAVRLIMPERSEEKE